MRIISLKKPSQAPCLGACPPTQYTSSPRLPSAHTVAVKKVRW